MKDDVGAVDTDTATVTINGIPPVADANGPYTALTYKTIEFDGSDSHDTDGFITNYTWIFYRTSPIFDGTILYGEKPTYIYTEAGTYNITLQVTDNHNLTDTDTTTVTVILDSDKDGLSDEIENIIGSDPNEETGFIILEISGIEHYLIDLDNNGQYDTFYNSTSKITTTVELKDGKYLIDDDGDGIFDYIYNPATGEITSYQPEPEGEAPWIYIATAVIIIILFFFAVIWYARSKK